MRGLVLLVIGVGDEHRGEAIEADDAIRLRIGNPLRFFRRPQMAMIGRMRESPRRLPAKEIGVERRIEEARPKPVAKRRTDVACSAKLRPDPRGGERAAVVSRGMTPQTPKDGLGCDHARFHRGVAALDLRHIEKAGRAADHNPAREADARDRLKAALVQSTRAISDAPAAGESGPDRGMGLEALKLLERAQIRIVVVEADNEADRDLAVLEMIEKRSAISLAIERPADRVDDAAGMMLGRIDLPQLFDADTVSLRPAVAAEIELRLEALGQRAAAALGKERLLGDELDARLELRRRLAVFANPLRAGRNPAHAPQLVIEHFRRGKAGIDLDPERLRLFAEPAAEIGNADDVVAAIVHLRWRRQAKGAALGQEQETIVHRRRYQRRAALPPIRQQLIERARLEHRARENMRPDLGAFLDDADRELAARFRGKLLQADGGGKPRRPRTDDHHVVFHPLAFHRPILSAGRHYRKYARREQPVS